jgi:hypothetical protein
MTAAAFFFSPASASACQWARKLLHPFVLQLRGDRTNIADDEIEQYALAQTPHLQQ